MQDWKNMTRVDARIINAATQVLNSTDYEANGAYSWTAGTTCTGQAWHYDRRYHAKVHVKQTVVHWVF